MNSGIRPSLGERIIARIEVTTITALQMLLVVLVVVATVALYVLFAKNLYNEMAQIESVTALLPAMQRSFAGILTVVLGLELLETLKAYFTEHHVRLEVILVVAIIAVSRHLIQVDFEHTSGGVLLGLSAVVAALTLGYFLLKKTQVGLTSGNLDGSKNVASDS
jgi:uncharacterized membrane protein (DUF373 family)